MALVHGIPGFAGEVFTPDSEGYQEKRVQYAGVELQVAAEAWYVASPNLTVAETRRLNRIGKAVDELLDKVQSPG
jgi:hypothetical protein